MPTIHPTAIIGQHVELADDVVVGPYCQIGVNNSESKIRIGSGTVLHGDVIISGDVDIGENNQIYHGVRIGIVPQDRSYKGEPTHTVIGNENILRENVTIERGTTHGRGETTIGDNCMLMVGAHVAHDCQIGSRTLLIKNVMLAGHVTVGEGAVLGAGAGVHQHCRIGPGAMVGAMSKIVRDVLPFCLVDGNPAVHEGLNYIGLKRSGVENGSLRELRNAFETLYTPQTTFLQQVALLRDQNSSNPQIKKMLEFIGDGSSKRGITSGANSEGLVPPTPQFPESPTPLMMAHMKAVMEHGRFIGGAEVKELEQKLAAYVGVKHCITCNSGTDALQLAMMALGIKAGDEVIVPTFTYFATAEAALLRGIVPVPVDINPETYTLDIAQIEGKITPRTKAILPVSLFGQCADMDAINALAKQHGLAVIEDGAQSFGATYNGNRSLGLSDVGCTSFYPSKPLGCYGDGGACFTNDDALAEKLRMAANHGQRVGEPYLHHVVGMNSRLDSFQAAILLAKMATLETDLENRRAIAAFYDARFDGVLKTPKIADGNDSVFAQYMVVVPNRDVVIRALQEKGVDARIFYEYPVHRQPVMAEYGFDPKDFPNAEAASRSIMSIPLSPNMTRQQQEYTANAVIEAVSIVQRIGTGTSAWAKGGTDVKTT